MSKRSRTRPVAVNPRGGTPGAPRPDGRSRPSDADELVNCMAAALECEPGAAKAVLDQARRDLGAFIKSGWSPGTVLATLLVEAAMAAHHSQRGWPQFSAEVAEMLPQYYDIVGRWLASRGESHEVRDATEGVIIPAGARFRH